MADVQEKLRRETSKIGHFKTQNRHSSAILAITKIVCLKNSFSVGAFPNSKRTPICVGTLICRELDAAVSQVLF